MEVVSKSSALLSNYEVLALLSELEANQLAKTRSHLAAKKEEESAVLNGAPAPPVAGNPTHDEVPQNLRTIEVELIAHLRNEYPLMQLQNDTAIRNLTRALSKFELTKSEKLQIVNLAPQQTIELYIILENIEERFSEDDLDEMMKLVKQSFLIDPATLDESMSGAQVNGQMPSHASDSQTTAPGELSAWGVGEGDIMEDYLVHEAGGGVDDLEMDDTEE
ncbi:DNA-directed RNA polymerase II subunit RPB4 [Ceratobasidium sp. AG-Ba]|nr:DNA-directed RNA polymerase II subunit RPB4 [Ceratobasidium sp. AG-Ba]